MSPTVTHVLAILAGVLVGGIAALKVIAPLTANTVDDSVLARLEQLEPASAPAAK